MAKLGGIQQGILQQGGLSFLGAQQGLLPTLASKYIPFASKPETRICTGSGFGNVHVNQLCKRLVRVLLITLGCSVTCFRKRAWLEGEQNIFLSYKLNVWYLMCISKDIHQDINPIA